MLLSHYTSGRGLLGIVESKSIWASHVAFLNDASEFRYAFDTAREVVERFSRLREHFAPRSPGLAKLIVGETTHLERGHLPNVFVTSFSALPGDLSQWRGYTRPGDGYTIQVDLDALRGAAGVLGWRLEPVLYGASADSEISRLAEDAFRALESGRYAGIQDPEGAAHAEFTAALRDRAPTLKHPAFEDEQEWRLISPPYDYWSPEVFWRPGPSYLVPYLKFPLGEPESGPVRGFSVGPGPNGELASGALLMLINQKGYHVGVGMPGTPYRPW